MYKYETHLHTFPVSRCGKASVEETLAYYKAKGYAGVFITNHFLDGNINIEDSIPYAKKVEFYFSDYERGVEVGKTLGIPVFCGVEISYHGTDFLIYGLDKGWFLSHPEIMDMKYSARLRLMMDAGALIIQAHPYREAHYIDHIRLLPRCVHGVEVINSCQSDAENAMARTYARYYGLLEFAGSDNHAAGNHNHPYLAGVCCKEPVSCVEDFVAKVKNGETEIFTEER
ncbi:MAG: histidinol phosphatase [Oscillospiraceae bacterium]|nr:histidinol phosphatase [Oscillospiraceae bacterium]